MNKQIIISSSQEEKIKKQLQTSIFRKREILELWMEKVETLRIELELVKNEYNVRIGYLFLKDNQLDLEIIQLKNLKKRLDEGMNYQEAIKAEEDTFYNEILRMQKEQEKIEEEKKFFEKRQELPLSVQENIKEIWKKLIRQYHPDLVTNAVEKERRERVMKQVNNAYAAGDLDKLLQFTNDMHVETIDESSIEKLESILVETENLLADWKGEFAVLKNSEWYEWKKRMEKGKKEKIDIFVELEGKLLDDIVKKIALLRDLRSQIKQPEQNEIL